MMGARFLSVGVGGCRSAKGGAYNDLCGNGLELDTSVSTHAYLNVDTNGNI